MNTKSPESAANIKFPSGKSLDLTHPRVMGILNVTPDSFSDGGKFMSLESAVTQATRMIDEGADIIDIGGESSRPGAEPLDAEQEIHRVVPVIEAIRRRSSVVISIDTYKAVTARAALSAGADMVNDISALRLDPDLAGVVAERKVPLVLMHMLGEPRTMQENPRYVDCIREISEFFRARIDHAVSMGIDRTKLVLDPGIGFGKRPVDNLDILTRLGEFRSFGLPLLVGASRKSFIGAIDSGATVEQRLGGSIAAAVIAAMNGADMVRVHDVRETVQAIRLFEAVRQR
jgi:dihydropteroate synthase